MYDSAHIHTKTSPPPTPLSNTHDDRDIHLPTHTRSTWFRPPGGAMTGNYNNSRERCALCAVCEICQRQAQSSGNRFTSAVRCGNIARNKSRCRDINDPTIYFNRYETAPLRCGGGDQILLSRGLRRAE